ncbi:hypothetical protein [Tabrizicola fusiformis]|nr:hypothetical protein [Tabrizicola sp. SY72]
MLTLLAQTFRIATRTEWRDAPPQPSRDWPAPPHWLLPRPGEGRF